MEYVGMGVSRKYTRVAADPVILIGKHCNTQKNMQILTATHRRTYRFSTATHT